MALKLVHELRVKKEKDKTQSNVLYRILKDSVLVVKDKTCKIPGKKLHRAKLSVHEINEEMIAILSVLLQAQSAAYNKNLMICMSIFPNLNVYTDNLLQI
ncbi:CLUMA_CG005375, isoform A [Clunio marinus]|uniref:CLUMA_CG005375, isoform A n=1 Tax=Clunio marinus TaxID=568069 RepID=A0A1J1HUR1_9DIPT|nr:CLUMA_CG005375, isoform A [Clunio marinus]